MNVKHLSLEDQRLLATDFGDLDKVAEEQVKVASEMYTAGAEMALATADQMDKLAAESEKEEEMEDEEDEGEKKAAADYGNIITEGFIDKLAALGEERYGNADHYFIPFMEEKVAAAAASAGLAKFKGILSDLSEGAKALPAKMRENAAKMKAQAGQAKQRVGDAAKNMRDMHVEGAKDFMTGVKGNTEHLSGLSAGERARRMGKGLGKMSPAIAAVGGTGGGIYAATRKKKDEAAS
jgi:hypothetical protein